jgi:chaperonin cofactor prefoldin
MSFDTQVPHAIATLEKEASNLRSQMAPLENQIDTGQAGGGCECSCSACDDCEERDYLSDDEIEELEARLKPLTEKYADVETTIKRLQRWAEFRHIELEPAKATSN